MKLSICIPIYNFDVRSLVYDLKKQILTNSIDAEIVLIDDASNENFIQKNVELKSSVTQFIFLKNNIGRSNIRNLFTQYTEGDYLLFLDCDGKIVDNNFLQKYTAFLINNKDASVIYGGRIIPNTEPSIENYLRWKYAKERENPPLYNRLEKPYLTFQSNNFIVKKDVLLENPFNTEFSRYGYEDVWLALSLKENNIPIHHIDNAILNNDVESNKTYLEKVQESVINLVEMLNKEPQKAQQIKLIRAFLVLKKTKLDGAYYFLFNGIKNKIVKILLSGSAPLYYLDIYKLGLLTELYKKWAVQDSNQ